MNSARNENTSRNKQETNSNATHPHERNNLDSRKNLEINDDPSGHNAKEVHNGEKNERNETRGGKPKK